MSVRPIGVTPSPFYEQDKNPKPLPVVEPSYCKNCKTLYPKQLLFRTPMGKDGDRQLLCAKCWQKKWKLT